MIISRLLKAISLLNAILTIINPISYKVEHLTLNSRPQTTYTLAINMENEGISLENVLSFDVLYGFEKTSDMAKNHNALFGVNGMFYDSFGMTYGILIMGGKVVTMDSIYTPTILVTQDGKVSLEEISIKGQVKGKNNTIDLLGTNRSVPNNTWVLFDKVYGATTRVRRPSINYLITNQVVKEIVVSDMPVGLKNSDYVLTHVVEDEIPTFEIGEKVAINFEVSNGLTNIKEAFQTGGWLVNEGKNVAKDFESFTGATTAPNPRTLVGITEDHRIIFKVIDGRIPAVSAGVSGYEAAELMLLEGCKYAAYLDGGASSTMVVRGEVVNMPSDKEERDVAHSVIIRLEE